MNLKRLVNDYTECNSFEIKVTDNKVKIYYYDKLINILNNKISVISNNKKYDIEGKNLNIDTMYQEFIIISGTLEKIIVGTNNENLR